LQKKEVNLDELVRETLIDFQWTRTGATLSGKSTFASRCQLTAPCSAGVAQSDFQRVKFSSARAEAKIESSRSRSDGRQWSLFAITGAVLICYAHKLFVLFNACTARPSSSTGIGLANVRRIIAPWRPDWRTRGDVGATFTFPSKANGAPTDAKVIRMETNQLSTKINRSSGRMNPLLSFLDPHSGQLSI